MMDELERLVSEYRTRAHSSVKSRLDVLVKIEHTGDSRIVPFLLELLEDRSESDAVRLFLVKQLRKRNGFIVHADRGLVARAVGDVLVGHANEEFRLQAALTLGEFTEIDGVLSRLAVVSLAGHESIDVRYAAFTSIERAGPASECVALMREIARDDALGAAARTALSAWHVEQP